MQEECRARRMMGPFDLIENGKIKRYFKSKNKLNTPGLVSHLTQRSAGSEPLFVEEDDYLTMLSLFREIEQKYDLNVYALCLMPNHTHFLLSPEEKNLSDAMRDLFSRYAAWFNRKYERKGHLVGSPYRQAVCLDDSYLIAASLYIHLNPVRAGLSAKSEAYRWSSSRLFCNDDAPSSFVDPSFVLGLLAADIDEARLRYRVLLKNGQGLKAAHVLEQEDAIERFRKKLVASFPRLFGKIDRHNRSAEKIGADLLSRDRLDRRIRELKNGRLSKPESQAAKRYIIQQLLARGFKRKEIASRLGISRKTVYNLLKSNQ